MPISDDPILVEPSTTFNLDSLWTFTLQITNELPRYGYIKIDVPEEVGVREPSGGVCERWACKLANR